MLRSASLEGAGAACAQIPPCFAVQLRSSMSLMVPRFALARRTLLQRRVECPRCVRSSVSLPPLASCDLTVSIAWHTCGAFAAVRDIHLLTSTRVDRTDGNSIASCDRVQAREMTSLSLATDREHHLAGCPAIFHDCCTSPSSSHRLWDRSALRCSHRALMRPRWPVRLSDPGHVGEGMIVMPPYPYGACLMPSRMPAPSMRLACRLMPIEYPATALR